MLYRSDWFGLRLPDGFGIRDHVRSGDDPHHTTSLEKKGSHRLASVWAFGASEGVICKYMHADNFGG